MKLTNQEKFATIVKDKRLSQTTILNSVQAAEKLRFSPHKYRRIESGQNQIYLEDAIQIARLYRFSIVEFEKVFE